MTQIKEIFIQLDQDARELLFTIINLKVSLITENDEKARKEIEKALLLVQKIQSNLCLMKEGVKG